MPVLMPKLSFSTLARGAKQFVVHEAFETTFMLLLYCFLLTPTTIVGESFEGAEMTTFLAPLLICLDASSVVVDFPVDSMI